IGPIYAPSLRSTRSIEWMDTRAAKNRRYELYHSAPAIFTVGMLEILGMPLRLHMLMISIVYEQLDETIVAASAGLESLRRFEVDVWRSENTEKASLRVSRTFRFPATGIRA
ncbi:hypothetical protein BGX29_000714, partial [Mortierella sp. GBA35]